MEQVQVNIQIEWNVCYLGLKRYRFVIEECRILGFCSSCKIYKLLLRVK